MQMTCHELTNSACVTRTWYAWRRQGHDKKGLNKLFICTTRLFENSRVNYLVQRSCWFLVPAESKISRSAFKKQLRVSGKYHNVYPDVFSEECHELGVRDMSRTRHLWRITICIFRMLQYTMFVFGGYTRTRDELHTCDMSRTRCGWHKDAMIHSSGRWYSNTPMCVAIQGSCHTYEWVMSRVWMSRVTRMNESFQRYEWVITRIWMSYTTCMIETCHTYEWGVSHIWMSHVVHVNESRHTYEWVMSHIWISHVTHMNESYHTYDRVMSHVWMSHVTRMNKFCHTYEWVMSHMWMSHVTHMNESYHTSEWVMAHV